MFADTTPTDATTSLLPTLGLGLAAIVFLVIAWKLLARYGMPSFDGISDRLRGLLIMRGRPSGMPPTKEPPAAPALDEGGTVEAPRRTTTGAPAATAAARPLPTPQPDAANTAAPDVEGAPSTGAIKALIVAAALPSLFALPYIAWSIAALLIDRVGAPAAAAWTAGLVADVALIGSVVVALSDAKSRVAATRAGWVFAVVAAGLVAVHAGWSVAVVIAVIPLLSKALWGLVVDAVHRLRAARAAHAAAALRRQEEAAAAQSGKAAELSTDLEHERLAEIAQLERDALYEEQVAAAKLKVKLARSQAEHLEALAEIERLGEQKRAEDEESAKVYENQLRLERKIRALRGDAPGFLSPGDAAPGVEDAELVGEVTAKAGFGSAAPAAFGFQRPLDIKALTPEGASVRFEDLPDHHQALVKYVHTAKEPTMREAGRKLNRDGRTIGRWVEKLTELGYELPFDRKK